MGTEKDRTQFMITSRYNRKKIAELPTRVQVPDLKTLPFIVAEA